MDSSHQPFHSTTLELRDRKEEFKSLLHKILKAADLNVQDIRLVEDKKINERLKFSDDLPDDLKSKIIDDFRFTPEIGYPVYNRGKITNKLEYFNLANEESTGTLKMYDIAGEILNALQKGTILIIDEFNSGLHSLLNKFVVDLFVNPCINQKNAQLLITTHDTCVLDLSILKREQIWFTDKTECGSTELFSLDEFDKNTVRDNSKYSKYYLDGRFKAVPATNSYELINGLF